MKQHDDSRPGSFKSGGRRIDDHSSWIGAPGKDSRFPDGPHKTKDESSAQGGGSVMKYEETSEAIKGTQMAAKGKMAAHPLKPGTRN
jgi:hypothetical protein